MRVRAWRRLMLAVCLTGLLAFGAVACAETPEVVIRPTDEGFLVIGTIGDETHFHLLNDSDRDLQASIVALDGHTLTQLREAVSGGELPEWATEVGTLQAPAGEAAAGTFETPDDSYAVIELSGEEPLLGELHRTEPEGEEALAAGEGEGGAPAVEATLPPLPPAGAVGSATGTVNVTMDEFTVAADPESIGSGQITFNLRNEGAVVHELVVIRTEAEPDALPVSGGAVDEANPGLQVMGEIPNVAAGASGNMTAGMPAGSYVLICNVPGHYNAGMYAPFTVQ